MDKKNRNRIAITITAFCIYTLLTTFYYHIDKYITGILFFILTLLVPTTLVIMIVYFFKNAILAFRGIQNLSFQLFLPLIISTITLIYVFLCPNFDSENLESDVAFRACYEGTQNQATLKFREDKTFEYHGTGVFFASNWYYGVYEQKADTLYLHYTTEKPRSLGDTLVINGDNLITINQADSLQRFIPFYLGYCKGLN
jgi:hypothetical protein